MLCVLNYQIKKLDPTSKRVSTIAGTGKAGFKDGTAVKAQVGKMFYAVFLNHLLVGVQIPVYILVIKW